MSLLEWMSDEARHGKALKGLPERYFKKIGLSLTGTPLTKAQSREVPGLPCFFHQFYQLLKL